MPVHKRAVGILFPCPHVQRIKRRETEPIRCVEQVKELSHELGRTLILRVPHGSQNQIVSTDQAQSSAWHRLVDHDLGARGLDHSAVYKVPVYELQPHRPRAVTANTAELKGIPLSFSDRHILEALGRIPHNL